MKTVLIALFLTIATSTPAVAQNYVPVTEKAQFLELLAGKSLSNRLYGVTIAVSPNGTLSGTGAGWEINGTWSWQDGYFCREMTWGGDPVPYNCQLVEYAGGDMRFTTDQGTGRSAAFTLR